MTIPARAHFFWIGPRLCWAHVFAILSASQRSGLSEITLHHTDALDDGPEFRALLSAPNITLSALDAIQLVRDAGQALGLGEALAEIYSRLESPVAKTNILRAAILYLKGGIYLDLDTITTRSLLPLLDAVQFVGSEFIVWPAHVRDSRSPLTWARSLSLDILRKGMRRLANGWRLFRRVERLYHLGINGAVLGAEAKSPLLENYLRAMPTVAIDLQNKRHALGTKLLQQVVDRYARDDLLIQAPDVFYPLPPEISDHWFRHQPQIALHEVLRSNTRVVHWYASVRTRTQVNCIDPMYVREHCNRQLYSALVCESIDNLPVAA